MTEEGQCRYGRNMYHGQLMTRGVLAPEHRHRVKDMLMLCHYGGRPCGWKFPGIHGEGFGTGRPNDGDYSDTELRVLRFLDIWKLKS